MREISCWPIPRNGGGLPPAPRRGARLPPPLPTWIRLNTFSRRVAAGVSGLGAAVFLVAAVLCPYEDNGVPLTHGTHRQLGLPPCHFQTLFAMPCPSCGMTTSVSLCMHGDFDAAFRVNWAGVLVTVLGMGVTISLGMAAIGGWCPRWLTPDQAVQWFAIAGAAAACVRYVVLVAVRLVG